MKKFWKGFFLIVSLLSLFFSPFYAFAQQTQNNTQQTQNFTIYINGTNYPGSYFQTKHDLYVGLNSFENALNLSGNYNFPPQIEWQTNDKTYVSLEGASENLGLNLDINWGTGVVYLESPNSSAIPGNLNQNFTIYLLGTTYPSTYRIKNHDIYVSLSSFENALNMQNNYTFPPQIEWEHNSQNYISLEGAAENLGLNLDINWGTGVVYLEPPNASLAPGAAKGTSEQSNTSNSVTNNYYNNYYNNYGWNGFGYSGIPYYGSYSSFYPAIPVLPVAYPIVPGFNYSQCSNILSWQFWFAWECNPASYVYYQPSYYNPYYYNNDYYDSYYNQSVYQQPAVDVYVNSTSSAIISANPAPPPNPPQPASAPQPGGPIGNPTLNASAPSKFPLPVHQRIFNNPTRTMPVFPSRPVFHPAPSRPVFHPAPSRPVFHPAPSRPVFHPAPSRPVFRPAPSRPVFHPAPSRPVFHPAPSRPVFHPAPSRPVFHPAPSRPVFRPAPSRPAFRPAPSRPAFRPAPSRPAFRPAPSTPASVHKKR